MSILSIFLSSVAWAQEAAAPAAKPSALEQYMPLVIIVAMMYFLLLRPQQKRAQAHQKLLSELKRGDSVLTSGGILGTIEGLTDKFVTLKIADDVRIRILRSQIAGPTQEDAKS